MKHQYRFFWIIALGLFGFSLSQGTTYFVNATTGSNSNNGTSSGTAFKTITKALSVATNADVINVAAGTYNKTLGETFPLEMVSGVTLSGTAGALTTIVDASGDSNRVFNCDASSASTIIQGFTITGGYVTNYTSGGAQSKGGGMYIDNGSQVIIQNNIITRDTVRGYDFFQVSGGANGGTAYGGGIHIQNGTPTIRNNVISNNVSIGGGGKDFRGGFGGFPSAGGNAYGGGIFAQFAGSGTIIMNNTFYGNKALGGLGGSTNNGIDPGGNGGSASAGAVNVGFNTVARNNIFSTNTVTEGTHGGGNGGSNGTGSNGAVEGNTAENLSFNLYYNNTATTDPDGGVLGTNNVTASDPLFISTSNFHLSTTSSTAYHAGTPTGAPTTDLDGTLRSVTTPSIGAYEATDPLPVELVSFTAITETKTVILKWRTATEVNNYGFEIEKSRIQKSEDRNQNISAAWDKIGFVEGAGTTNAPKEYLFSDKNLSAGKYFYRLKQIDRDGQFTYSSEVEMTIAKMPTEFVLAQNYPNPFNPSTVISYQIPVNSRVSLKIFDAIGREVAVLVNEVKEAGYYNATFDATGLSSGIYFAKFSSEGKSQIRKLLLMK